MEFKGRISFSGDDELYPGWYLQYYLDGELHRKALWIYDSHARNAAVIAAADVLGCSSEEIQVGGPDWSTSPPG